MSFPQVVRAFVGSHFVNILNTVLCPFHLGGVLPFQVMKRGLGLFGLNRSSCIFFLCFTYAEVFRQNIVVQQLSVFIICILLSALLIPITFESPYPSFATVAVALMTIMNGSLMMIWLRIALIVLVFIMFSIFALADSLQLGPDCFVMSESSDKVYDEDDLRRYVVYLFLFVAIEIVAIVNQEYLQRVYFYSDQVVSGLRDDIKEERMQASALLELLIPATVLERMQSAFLAKRDDTDSQEEVRMTSSRVAASKGGTGQSNRSPSKRLQIPQDSTSVIRLLQSNVRPVIADKHEDVVVLFTDVRGFTAWSAAHHYNDVFSFLQAMCTRFDEIIAYHGVYKVEVIGDAYFITAGVPDVDLHQKTRRMLRCAFDMLQAMDEICSSDAEMKGLSIRVGVHLGPVVAGIVGIKNPRYHVFGNTVVHAEHLESSGSPGKVHVSEAVVSQFRKGDLEFQFTARDTGENTYFAKRMGEKSVIC